MADNTNEFKILLGAELDPNTGNSINGQIKNLKINTVPITLQLNQTSVDRVQDQIDNIRQQIQSLGNIRIDFGGGNNRRGVGSTTSALEKARRDTHNLYKQITSMDMKVAKLGMSGVDTGNIRKYEQQLFNLENTYRNLLNTLSSGGHINLDAVFSSIDKAKTELAQLSSEADNAIKSKAGDIGIKFDNGTFKTQLKDAEISLQRVQNQNVATQQAMKNLNDAFNRLETARANSNVEDLVDSHREFENALKNVNNQIQQNEAVWKQSANVAKLDSQRRGMIADLDTYLHKNSAAVKEFGNRIEDLKRRLQSCNDIELGGIQAEVKELKRDIELAGKNTKTFGDKIKDKFAEHGVYLSTALMFSYSARALKDMYENVVKVDTAMTELMKVTDETDATYKRFMSDAAKTAKEVGTTIDGIITSTADFARLGFELDDSQELAKVANIYAVVGDDIDSVDTATKSIISTMTAFNVEASNSISIVDKFNEVGNNFAISSGGIGDALERSASSMAAANNTLDETIALITAANTVVQNPEAVGTAFKTLSMRIRGAKTELEDAGLETEGMAKSTAELRKEIKALSGVDIMIDDNTFKSTYQIMDELSQKWQDLTDIQQASITELIAGKRQGNIISSLMNNFDIAREALETSIGAEGSAMQEHAKWMESIEAKLQKLTASWQSLSQTVVNSDIVKGGIDFLAFVVNLLDQIIGSIGSIGALGAGVAIANVFKVIKKTKGLPTLISLLNSAGWSFTNLKDAAALAGQGLKAFAKTPAGVASAIGLVVAAISTAIQYYKKLEAEEEERRQKILSTNNEFLDSVDAFEQAYVKYSGKTSLTTEEENELKDAINGTVTALGNKNGALQNATKNAEDYLKSLQDITREELTQSQLKAKENLDAARESLQSSSWSDLTGDKISVGLGNSKSNDKTNKSREIAKSLMGDYINREIKRAGKGRTVTYQIEPIGWDDSHKDMDKVVDYYYQLLNLKEKLIEESLEDEDFLEDNGVYKEVKSATDDLSGSVNEYLTQQYNLAKYNYEIANGIPTTVEEYYAMRDAILANINASEEYKNAIGDIADTEWGKIFDLTTVEKAPKTLGEKISAIVQAFVKSVKYTKDQALPFSDWLNSLNDGDKEILYTISVDSETAEWELDDWKNALKNYSRFSKEQRDDVIKQFSSDNAMTEWFTNLSTSERERVYQIGLESDDTDLWTLARWQRELAYLEEHGNTAAASMESFYDVMNNSEDGNFSEKIKSYTSTMDSLNEALEKIAAGTLTNDDKLALAMDFPELAYAINDTNLLQQAVQNLINTTNKGIGDEFAAQIEAVGGKETAAGQALLALQNMMNSAVSSDFDIEKEIDRFNDLYTAISESSSATGLSAESIANLKAMYSNLDGYDPSKLFERTENGIHLNEESLKALQEEYENTIALDFKDELENLQKEYEDTAKELEGLEAGTEEYDKTLNKMRGINDQIQDVQNLMSQYDGLTSAYNKWIKAQSADKERDSYENIGDQYDEMKALVEQGWFGDEELNAYLDLLLGVENRTGSVAEQFAKLGKTIDGTNHSLLDYWQYDKDSGDLVTDGLFNFLDDVNKILGSDFAWVGEDGKYNFDFSGDKIEKVAKAFGISTEMVQLFEKALIDTGAAVKMGIDYSNIDYTDDLKKAEEASKAAKESLKEYAAEAKKVNGESIDLEGVLNYDVSSMTIEDINEKIAELNNVIGDLDQTTKEGASAASLLNSEIANLNNAKTIQIAISINKAIEGGSTVEKLLEMDDDKLAATLGIDISVNKDDLNAAKKQLETLKTTADTSITVKIDEAQFDALTSTDKTVNMTVNVAGDDKVTALQATIESLSGTSVDVTVNTSEGETKVSTLQANINGVTGNTATVSVNTTDGEANVVSLQTSIDGVNGNTVIVSADTTVGNENATTLKTTIDGINGKTVVVSTDTADGQENVVTLQTTIDGVEGKTVTVSTDTSDGETNIANIIQSLISYYNEYNGLEVKTSVDAGEALHNIQKVLRELNALPAETKAELGLDDTAFQTALKNIDASVTAGVEPNKTDLAMVYAVISAITPEMIANVSVNDKEVKKYQRDYHGAKGTVEWGNDVTDVKTHFEATGTVTWTHNGVTYGGGGEGKPFVNGTAYARGNWGTKDSGVALGGELGQEVIVRDGRFFTIGDNGAEFFHYKKDDIIFNHKQSEELFKYGKIVSGGGRGRVYANGSANTNGKAFAIGTNKVVVSLYDDSGSGSSRREDSGKKTESLSKKTTKKKSSSKSSSSKKDFKETFDWIEVAIDRVERAISNLDLKASSVYRSWSSRNNNLKKEISEVGEEISIQQKGYERYLKEANSVGLSESWAKKVRDGKIDIESVKDEKLAEKIKDYQTWYEKALDCKYAVDELKETQSELYQQAFDNIVAQYDGFLSVIEHERNMLEGYISQSEASGYIVSTKYYDALINVEKANIEKLEKEKDALLNSLEEAVNSGTIKPDSEAWFEMVGQIDEVTLAIQEANTSLIEFNNSIRDIEWQIFDLLQEQISQITGETDFLIDLMSGDKLYDDSGQLTDEGMSAMGLHGQNYNTYMYQADKYAQEMLEVSKKLAEDPYNQTLIERRQDLLELQQESILAAEDEKKAIVDMVKEGIELELDALQELIDSYTEALDSQKDLYDYKKKIKQQTDEIASLEKQSWAYSGDNSEETRQKIQQIKVSLEEARENLEETEYDRYVSDQKQLLDSLYLEYETILNARLDNIDALIADMILEINASASTINATLVSKADEVGYNLSETMKNAWDTNTGNITTVLTTYGQGIQDGILNASTTLNAALSVLSVNIQNMVKESNTQANSNVQYSNTSSASYSPQAQPNIYDPSTAINANASASSSSSSKSKGSSSKKTSSDSKSGKDDGSIFDYKKDTYPKSKLNISESIVDRLKYFNYDSSFSARKSYYNEMGFSGTYTGSSKQNIQMLKWMKKNGYKHGVYKLSKDELAWTQEGRDLEAIIRPSDGAILTPLAKNDSVLKASATANIFDFANDPSEFIRNNLNIDGSISGVPAQNVGGNTYYNEFGIQIELPNVQNYEQFKYAMQHDKSFEKMVRAMTVDKMFGGSSLKKYNC